MKFKVLFNNVLSIKLLSKYILNEKFEILNEGRWEKYDNKYDARLDKRSANYGNDQLHIRNRNGEEWAYRKLSNNSVARSEPHKYKLSANKDVKNIVRNILELPQ